MTRRWLKRIELNWRQGASGPVTLPTPTARLGGGSFPMAKRKRFSALVIRPGHGSVWLDAVRLCNGYIEGDYAVPIEPFGGFYSETYRGAWPLSCLQKLVRDA